MNTILKKQDNTYGGYDYIEFNSVSKVYQTGDSRGHYGHFVGNSIAVNVTTKKELKQVEAVLKAEGYKEKVR